MSAPFAKLPAWADYGLIPLVNVTAAFLVSGLVVLFIGENPIEAVKLLVWGAFSVHGQNRHENKSGPLDKLLRPP